jgi:hypothetical protein
MRAVDPARQAAPRDRAERHVFETVPELDAPARRALALAELSGVPRAGIASEIGLAGEELSATLASARKALRRTRAQLGSGGRCERAERALSDRLDEVLTTLDARFLDAHLGRCARCRTHESELAEALEELRESFAEPVREPAAVKPPPARARLRIVPEPALLPPAPEPPALEPPAPEPPVLEPPVLVPVPEAVELPVAAPRASPARRDRVRAALPVAVAALLAVGLIAAAIALLSQFGSDPDVRAPWDAPDAPLVNPAPISAQ